LRPDAPPAPATASDERAISSYYDYEDSDGDDPMKGGCLKQLNKSFPTLYQCLVQVPPIADWVRDACVRGSTTKLQEFYATGVLGDECGSLTCCPEYASKVYDCGQE
jgi:hypothetical protein